MADEYHRRRRHDDAMALIWGQFSRNMRLDAFQRLKEHAARAGQWPAWRDKALAAIRSSLDKQQRDSSSPPGGLRRSWFTAADRSVLVEIFLWQGDAEAAWGEAQAGGCNDRLRMRLAKIREKDHPADTLAIYQRQIDPIVYGKNNDAYRDAARLIREIRQLMTRLGRQDRFGPYLASVRQAHKPKRNFMAMLSDF